MYLEDEIERYAFKIAFELKEHKWTLATAESCTGGLVAAAFTDVSGASEWFSGSVVAYANEVKQNVLKVPEAVLIDHGAVSEPVVLAMAKGVCAALGVDCGVSLSGIAGPTGGTEDKPVGTVWIGVHTPDGDWAEKFLFSGDRKAVRLQSTLAAIKMLRSKLSGIFI